MKLWGSQEKPTRADQTRLPVTCKALPSRLVRQRISCLRWSREANEANQHGLRSAFKPSHA